MLGLENSKQGLEACELVSSKKLRIKIPNFKTLETLEFSRPGSSDLCFGSQVVTRRKF